MIYYSVPLLSAVQSVYLSLPTFIYKQNQHSCVMKRKNVSIRDEQAQYLEGQDINLSALVRRRIDEVMEEGVIELK